MNSIYKVSELNNLNPENLVIIDDEHGGFGLGIKSEKVFNNIDFKFKKIQYKNIYYGIVLLKSDDNFYSCYVDMNEKNSLNGLKSIINSDFFNLVVFRNTEYNKVYRINNDIKNKILFDYSNNINNIQDYTTENISYIFNELNKEYSPEFLWNN